MECGSCSYVVLRRLELTKGLVEAREAKNDNKKFHITPIVSTSPHIVTDEILPTMGTVLLAMPSSSSAASTYIFELEFASCAPLPVVRMDIQTCSTLQTPAISAAGR